MSQEQLQSILAAIAQQHQPPYYDINWLTLRQYFSEVDSVLDRIFNTIPFVRSKWGDGTGDARDTPVEAPRKFLRGDPARFLTLFSRKLGELDDAIHGDRMTMY